MASNGAFKTIRVGTSERDEIVRRGRCLTLNRQPQRYRNVESAVVQGIIPSEDTSVVENISRRLKDMLVRVQPASRASAI